MSNSQRRRWPQLWGEKEPENNSKWSQGRINGPTLAPSSEGLPNLSDMYINTQHFYWIRGWKREEEKYEYSSSFIFQGISNPTGAGAGFDQFPSPLQKWQLSLLGPDRGLARCTGGPARRESAPVPSCPQTLINRGKYPMESLWEFLITQRPC